MNMNDKVKNIITYILAVILVVVIILQLATFNYIKAALDNQGQEVNKVQYAFTAIPTITPIPTIAPTATPEATIYLGSTSTPHITEMPSYLSNPDYTIDELVLAGIYSRMRYNEVRSLYKEPYYVSQYDNRESIGGWSTYAYYVFGSVSYLSDTRDYTEGGRVVTIHVMKEGYEGPNGIKIGDTVSEVFSKLAINYEYYENEAFLLYDENGNEFGEIEYFDSGVIYSLKLYNQENMCMEFYIDFINDAVSDFGIYEQLN